MSILRNPRFLLMLRVLFWLALVFAVTMALLPKPPHTPLDRLGDKFMHMLAFATLAGLGTLGFGRALRWRVVERLCFLGAMIEVAQSIPGLNRTCDIRDWIADCIAVVVAAGIASLLARRAESAAAAEG